MGSVNMVDVPEPAVTAKAIAATLVAAFASEKIHEGWRA